jgi:hypothetical protein
VGRLPREVHVPGSGGAHASYFVAIERFLASADAETLRDIVRAEAVKDNVFRNRLMTRIALEGNATVDFKEVSRSLKKLLRHGDLIDYRDSREYSNKLDEMRDVLQDLLQKRHSTQVVDMMQEFIPKIEDAYASSDDSAGYIGDSISQLADLFRKACEATKPNPRRFAKWLFIYDMASNWGEFGNSHGIFDDILGKEGVEIYRELVKKEWEKLPALNSSSRYGDQNYKLLAKFHVLTTIMNRIAEAIGDQELLLAIAKKDLRHPNGYLRVAELMQKSGTLAEAVTFIEQGKREFHVQHERAQFSPFLSDAYLRMGKKDAALDLYWRPFVGFPCLNYYKALKVVAEKAEEWGTWREKAIAHLRQAIFDAADKSKKGNARRNDSRGDLELQQNNSRLVEILLWEKRDDEAWLEANQNGCDEREWLALAAKREVRHPADCIPIYRRYCTRLLNGSADKRIYVETADALQKLAGVMQSVDEADKFLTIMEDIRLTFKARKNLIKELDKRKLP